MTYRTYENQGEVAIGDSVAIDSDCEKPSAFTTCIITDIQQGQVTLARPHAKTSVLGGKQAFVATEVFTVELERFVQTFRVFTTGPSGGKDNRGY